MIAADAILVLVGRWQMVRAEYEGEHAPELVTSKTILEILPGVYHVSFDGQIVDGGTVSPGASPTANSFTLVGDVGVNSGRTIRCIFQRVGNRLRVCYGLNNVEPTEFSASAGQNHYLATYRLITA